jgi:signal transduction histidine kinase
VQKKGELAEVEPFIVIVIVVESKFNGAKILPMNKTQQATELAALANYFSERREAILATWRIAVESDPKLSTASTLSRSQFNDQIPSVLNAFERELCAGHGPAPLEAAEEQKEYAAEHGLHRWHHGYNQEEVMREWGHLHLCLINELENYASAHPNLEMGVMPAARRALAQLCSDGVTESAVRYSRLQQVEAAGRIRDLERALAQVQEMERKRAEAWREAAHDLRGKVGLVNSVAEVLTDVPEQEQADYLAMLQESVASLRALLNDLMILSRLEAGHEQRNVETLDAAVMLRELCATMQPIASERNLFLKAEGPDTLPVQGDPVKIQRIAQNLLLNAITYTERGGVKVTWHACETGGVKRWEFCVQDTGPGFQYGTVTPTARALKEATEEARTVEEQSEEANDQTQPAPTLPSQSARRTHRQPSEGIGLSIVKRLCELLDASLELQTEIGKGSTFRVIFPRCYDTPDPTSLPS